MNKTLRVVESVTGLTFKEINSLDYDTERELIKKKTQKPVIFSKKKDGRVFGRGNPLLAQKRFTTIEEIDKRLEELIEKYDSIRKR